MMFVPDGVRWHLRIVDAKQGTRRDDSVPAVQGKGLQRRTRVGTGLDLVEEDGGLPGHRIESRELCFHLADYTVNIQVAVEYPFQAGIQREVQSNVGFEAGIQESFDGEGFAHLPRTLQNYAFPHPGIEPIFQFFQDFPFEYGMADHGYCMVHSVFMSCCKFFQ